MAGPVWRFEANRVASCVVCFREARGVFIEGEVLDNELEPGRAVCPDCYRRSAGIVVAGEAGAHAPAPAYGRKP